ncbi:hypothetical protein CDAR_78911 [Caerostris darwini]|uniref:Uncharacterized protein n=1 Tax=Caerostris darwini TaxID=1538125 RepID=A0AAV4Q423_9ARAC|nr:hypothetical protein CDAR_78911 [Caerostris darwini]
MELMAGGKKDCAVTRFPPSPTLWECSQENIPPNDTARNALHTFFRDILRKLVSSLAKNIRMFPQNTDSFRYQFQKKNVPTLNVDLWVVLFFPLSKRAGDPYQLLTTVVFTRDRGTMPRNGMMSTIECPLSRPGYAGSGIFPDIQ